MCMCEKPTRNDAPEGYGTAGRAPELQENDKLIFDECGRCRPQVNGTGSPDYHSHHFRLVDAFGHTCLLVRHGGGDERINLGGKHRRIPELLLPMDSDRRYLMLYALYQTHQEAARAATEAESNRWRQAAAEKRVKTQKVRNQAAVKVWIETSKGANQ